MNHALSDAYAEAKEALGRFDTRTIGDCETAIRQLSDEVEFIAELGGNGDADQVAAIKLGVGVHALSLAKLMPRLHSVIEQLEEFAGKKYLNEARKPFVGTRSQG